ncbi:MAG: hypothetical protein J5849_03145 [Clostridia bacterium]|nr:hypothetical protein [Clostridia bacterium]
MFGYVRPFTPDLRVRELEAYRAAYCGLCRTLTKEYGVLSSLLVNYDMVFAAMALTEESGECRFSAGRCAASPFRKKPCAVPNDALKIAAADTVILAYQKFLDDLRDEGFFRRTGKLFIKPFLKRRAKKAAEKYPELAFETERGLALYQRLESENCESVDRMLDAVGKGGEALAVYAKTARRERTILLYNAVRFMTIADALDDFQGDEKKKRFNLLRTKCPDSEKAKEFALGYLAMMTAETEKELPALEDDPYLPILRNTVFLGMRKTLEEIGAGRKRRKRGYPHVERSL